MPKSRQIITFVPRGDYVFGIENVPCDIAPVVMYAWRVLAHHPTRPFTCAMLKCKREAARVCYACSSQYAKSIAILLCRECAETNRGGRIKAMPTVITRAVDDRARIYARYPDLIPQSVHPSISDCDTDTEADTDAEIGEPPRKRARCASV